MKRKLWLLVLLQCLVLVFLAGQHYAVLLFGKEIVLKTVPVDPKDPFRGDFARLSYEISRIPAPETGDCKPGRKIHVLLEKQGDVYVYKDASFENRFVAEANQAVLTGKTGFCDKWGQTVQVIYGIEQAFVEEGMGKPLEDRNAAATVAAKVLNGRAVLDHVYIDGKLYR